MFAGLTAKLIAGGAMLVLLASAVAGIHLHGRSVGAGNERARWEEKVEQARVARDSERRQAAEALSIQALEFAEAEAVMREKAQEASNDLQRAIAANRELIDRCVIPDELLRPFRPRREGGTGGD